MFIKLCGLRTIADVKTAIEAGPSALGFILAESKRQVTPEFVASVRDKIPMLPTVVGVTVNRTADDLYRLFESARLDMIQLSGNEPIGILNDLAEIPLIKALSFPTGTDFNVATSEVYAWLNHRHAPELVMIDAHVPGEHGGTGKRADQRLVSEITVRYPVVLAGGLTPENVAEAIRTLQPIGVDTASGTETDGVKDPKKLRAFVANARTAFEQL